MTPSIRSYRDILAISSLLARLEPGIGPCTVEDCVHHPAPPPSDGRR